MKKKPKETAAETPRAGNPGKAAKAAAKKPAMTAGERMANWRKRKGEQTQGIHCYLPKHVHEWFMEDSIKQRRSFSEHLAFTLEKLMAANAV